MRGRGRTGRGRTQRRRRRWLDQRRQTARCERSAACHKQLWSHACAPCPAPAVHAASWCRARVSLTLQSLGHVSVSKYGRHSTREGAQHREGGGASQRGRATARQSGGNEINSLVQLGASGSRQHAAARGCCGTQHRHRERERGWCWAQRRCCWARWERRGAGPAAGAAARQGQQRQRGSGRRPWPGARQCGAAGAARRQQGGRRGGPCAAAGWEPRLQLRWAARRRRRKGQRVPAQLPPWALRCRPQPALPSAPGGSAARGPHCCSPAAGRPPAGARRTQGRGARPLLLPPPAPRCGAGA